MQSWRALATDFDGTIASEGVVLESTRTALARLKATGVTLLLVTGRELRDFPGLDVDLGLFDLVVAENGALLYDPKTSAQTLLAPHPSEAFVAELQRRNVTPLSVGHTIVATTEPNEVQVLESIKALGQ